jgi:hypothetical protein
VSASRESRIARALRVVADFAGRSFHPGVDHVDLAARFLLTAAAPMAVSSSAAFALGGVTRTSTVPGASAYDAPILAVVEALCGNLAAFEGLDRDRRVNVLRFALACLTYHTHPRLGWGPDRVQIGAAAWREVGQVATAHQRAA